MVAANSFHSDLGCFCNSGGFSTQIQTHITHTHDKYKVSVSIFSHFPLLKLSCVNGDLFHHSLNKSEVALAVILPLILYCFLKVRVRIIRNIDTHYFQRMLSFGANASLIFCKLYSKGFKRRIKKNPYHFGQVLLYETALDLCPVRLFHFNLCVCG